MHQIYYVTLDPERALGVEDLLLSFHILHSDESQLAESISNKGIDIKRFPKSEDAKLFNTSKLLQNEDLQKYISRTTHGRPDILVFKNDEKTEQICKELDFNLLNSSALVSKKFEGNKVEFSKFISQLNIFDYPKFEEFQRLSDLSYDSLSQKYGNEFVIQFSFGHSGSGTFFINTDSELRELQNKLPLRQGKVLKKINGPTYTLNACITKLGIIIGGISEQITGIEELTSSEGGTVGNDFTQRHLDDNSRRDLIDRAMRFGEVLNNEGHKGIFGLDFVIDEETGKFYLIEVNMRQVLSCGFTSYLQRDLKQMPIMLWHMLELLDHDYSTPFNSIDETSEQWINERINEVKNTDNLLELNIKNNQPIDASQIFFRNIKDHNVKITEQFPSGIYRIRGRNPEQTAEMEDNDEKYPAVFKLREDGWSSLCLMKRGYNILEAKELDGFLITSAPENAVIPPLGEVGRIQVLQSAFSSKRGDELNGWIMDAVKCIYENMRSEKEV